MEHSRDFAGPGSPEAGIVASTVYSAGRRVTDIAIDEAGGWARKDGHYVWIGLLEPSRELLARVQRQFGLPLLVIGEAVGVEPRPKRKPSPCRARRSAISGEVSLDRIPRHSHRAFGGVMKSATATHI